MRSEPTRQGLLYDGGKMKVALGLILIIIGIALGLYVGGYLLFFGGIVQVVSSVSPLVPVGIAVGVVKIVSASFIGVLLFVLFGSVGGALLQ